MNEWAAAAPIFVETEPAPSVRRGRLQRWAVGLIIALAILMVWSSALLLIFKRQYSVLEIMPAIVLLAVGEIAVMIPIYLIAWRFGRLK